MMSTPSTRAIRSVQLSLPRSLLSSFVGRWQPFTVVLEGFPRDLFALLDMLLVQTHGWHIKAAELAMLCSIAVELLGKKCDSHLLVNEEKVICVSILSVSAVYAVACITVLFSTEMCICVAVLW